MHLVAERAKAERVAALAVAAVGPVESRRVRGAVRDRVLQMIVQVAREGLDGARAEAERVLDRVDVIDDGSRDARDDADLCGIPTDSRYDST